VLGDGGARPDVAYDLSMADKYGTLSSATRTGPWRTVRTPPCARSWTASLQHSRSTHRLMKERNTSGRSVEQLIGYVIPSAQGQKMNGATHRRVAKRHSKSAY